MNDSVTTTAFARSVRETKTPCDVISGDDDLDTKHDSNSDQGREKDIQKQKMKTKKKKKKT